MTDPTRVLTALARLQDEVANTWVEPLVNDVVAALGADTTAVDIRQELECAKAERDEAFESMLQAGARCISLKSRVEAAEASEMRWRGIIGEAIFALRYQPDLTREQIAEGLVNALDPASDSPEEVRL